MANEATPHLIALIGTESTGKTTLCRDLARYFNGLWVPEAVRDFCTLHGRPPHAQEQPAVIEQQLKREQQAREAATRLGLRFVFCDTTPLMTAIYSDLVFNDRSLIAQAATHQRGYSLTLFTQPDIGWQHDGVRDGAHVQPKVTQMLTSLLAEYEIAHVQIRGTGPARLSATIDAVQALQAQRPLRNDQ
jgi:nicotinamide riboside kinase